jgi:hypothetical protein
MVVRKFLLANVLFDEVKDKQQKQKGQKRIEVIHRVLVGRMIRKYHMKKALKNECCLSRYLIDKSVSHSYDDINAAPRRRLVLARTTITHVEEYFNSVSRIMPDKGDATKVSKYKKRCRQEF